MRAPHRFRVEPIGARPIPRPVRFYLRNREVIDDVVGTILLVAVVLTLACLPWLFD